MLSNLPRFPCASDKRPLIQDWPNRATFDPLNDYGPPWINEHLWPLTGVLTGSRSGIAVLDIDPAGIGWLQDNRDRLGETRIHWTPRGRHLLYRCPGGLRCSAGRIARGVDVRADGGYVIWWPRQGLKVIENPIAEWPEFLGKGACAISNIQHAPSTVENRPGELRARTSAILTRIENESVGNRNNILHWAACQFTRMGIAPAVTEELLIGAARQNGLIRDDGIEKVRNTIRSGITKNTEEN